MGAVVDLDRLLDQRRIWRGRQVEHGLRACSLPAMPRSAIGCPKAAGRLLHSRNCCWPVLAAVSCNCSGQAWRA